MISDHKLISTTIQFNHSRQHVQDQQQEHPGTFKRLIDQMEHMMFTDRFNTQSRGDENYWKQFQSECHFALTPLAQHWKQSINNGVIPEVETAWAQLTHQLHSTASATIGIRANKKVPHSGRTQLRARMKYQDHQLREWKRDRRILWKYKDKGAMMNMPWGQHLQQLERKLNNNINHHFRNAIRSHQVTTLSTISSLKPHRMREYWQAMKCVGNLHSTAPTIPSIAIDTAGVTDDDLMRLRMYGKSSCLNFLERMRIIHSMIRNSMKRLRKWLTIKHNNRNNVYIQRGHKAGLMTPMN